MPTFRIQKLIRDKITPQQLKDGAKPTYRKLSKPELIAALVEKLKEEAEEIPLDNPAEATKEIADVQQIIDDLAELLEITPEQIKQAQAKKNDKMGPFKEGYYSETLELSDDSPWLDYYLSNPEQYPRIDSDT